MKFELKTENSSVKMKKDTLVMEDIINAALSVGIEYNAPQHPEVILDHKKLSEVIKNYEKPNVTTPYEPAPHIEKLDGKPVYFAAKSDSLPKPVTERPKKVGLKGSENLTGFDVAEAAKWEMSEDVERVTAKAVCPDCKNITIEKVYPWFSFVKCSACDTKVYIKDDRAKPNQKYGDSRFFTKEEREEHQTDHKPAAAKDDNPTKTYIDNKISQAQTNAFKVHALNEYTIPTLTQYAKDKKITLKSNLNKSDIIQTIINSL